MVIRREVSCTIDEQLDHIRMSSKQREAARNYLRQGVLAAQVIITTWSFLRSVTHRIKHGLRRVTVRTVMRANRE